MSKKSKIGRPRSYKYEGSRKVSSIRLTDKQKEVILKRFGSIQNFINKSLLLNKIDDV